MGIVTLDAVTVLLIYSISIIALRRKYLDYKGSGKSFSELYDIYGTEMYLFGLSQLWVIDLIIQYFK